MSLGTLPSAAGRRLVAALLAWWAAECAAFPPLPPHQIYGLVRDRIGNPVEGGAEVVFESTSGTRLRGSIALQREGGVNYRIDVPLEAGLSAAAFQPTALQPTAPFRLRVRIGTVTYLPMEMSGNAPALGLPGQASRFDLTLGIDADGNGLPDDWERMVSAYLRRPWSRGSIRPGDAYPDTGMTFQQVYLAGVYAMAPKDGIALGITPRADGTPVLAFTAVKGRSYSIHASSEIGAWSPVPFRLAGAAAGTAAAASYFARDTRVIEVEVPVPAPASADAAGGARFFRLMVE